MRVSSQWPCTQEEPLILHQTGEAKRERKRERWRKATGRKTKWKPIIHITTAMQSSLMTSPSVLPSSLFPSFSSSEDFFTTLHLFVHSSALLFFLSATLIGLCKCEMERNVRAPLREWVWDVREECEGWRVRGCGLCSFSFALLHLSQMGTALFYYSFYF